MMKKLQLSFLFFCTSFSVFSQMYINNPQDWWWHAPASLENVEIEVRTLGAYAETAIAFDLYLDEPDYFYDVDLLEFVFDFKLNEGAVVNDSWLWINDYISKGDVYEQGEGTQIYESIVDRQQDPSILTQLSSTEYNLKVYPMKWDSTRRVRISYLEPLKYTGKQAKVDLPLGLLNFSKRSPEHISITVFDDTNYTYDDLNSDDWVLEEAGSDFKVFVNNDVFEEGTFSNTPVSFTFSNQEVDYFLSTYEGESDNYYQLVYYPEIELENSVENRMIVFDFDPFTSDKTYGEIKNELSSALLTMTEEDHFMVCHSDFVTQFSSDDWLPATQENIQSTLDGLVETSANIESRLSTLLPEALNKVEELGQTAEIIVLSPNNEYQNETKAKAFLNVIDEFYAGMGTEVSISVVDYADSKPETTIDGIVYRGNDYIYQSIADQTGGYYFSELSGDNVTDAIAGLMSSSVAYTDQYEFHLSVENGFVYSEYDNLKNEIEIRGDKPIISMGKYFGDGPFEVEFNARVDNQIYGDEQSLDPEVGYAINEMTETIWFSEYIKSVQHSGAEEDKRKIIETSIEERLLSMHTVFLCLEPGFESISANNNNEGGGIILSVGETDPQKDIALQVFPNPFVENLTVEFSLEDASKIDQVLINILDAQGRQVDRIVQQYGLNEGVNQIQWQPSMKLTDGIYIIQVLIDDKMYNQKVLHVRY